MTHRSSTWLFSSLLLLYVFATADIRKSTKFEFDLRLYPECDHKDMHFNFSGMGLTSIKEGFIESPLIKCLSFQNNKIESIAKGAFSKVTNLSYLNVANNNIIYTDLFSFGGHPSLKTLIMDNNINKNNGKKYTNVDGQFPQLTYLSLQNTGIKGINFWKSFPQLTYLNLAYNNANYAVVSFPTRLTHLYLENNDIFTGDFGNLKDLKVLSLSRNKITHIYSYNTNAISLTNLPKLEFLSFENNRIIYISPRVFSNMMSLISVDLSRNQLTKLTENVFEQAISLQNLTLSDNMLLSIDIFSKNSNITVLSADRNAISSLSSGEYYMLPNLRVLSLNNNRIEHTFENTFTNMKSLEELYLSRNELRVLSKELGFLEKLRYIDVSFNRFISLSDLGLHGTSSVSSVKFDGNPLAYIRATDFIYIPKYAVISINATFFYL